MEEHILRIFETCDAVWIHDGDPKKPHAQLSSGLCSNAYFDCRRVLRFTEFCEALAALLVEKLKEYNIGRPDWVIGSPNTAITLSYEVAKKLDAIHGFTEKDPKDPTGRRMIWNSLEIQENSTILQIDEVVVTGYTIFEVHRAIQNGNGEKVKFLPVVGTLIHRPPKLPVNYKDIKIVSLIEKEVQNWNPKECPLCKVGSPRFPPRTHWKELTGKR